jgi:ANTAR domain
MVVQIEPGEAVPASAEGNLDAFLQHRADLPRPCGAPLLRSLSRLSGSDDPVVTFARLPQACVPEFSDGCQVELCDGTEPSFLIVRSASSAEESFPAPPVGHVLATPFRVVSRLGYPSYAGAVTHWWIARSPSESDAVIADLMVKHVVALVDHERLMAAVTQAEDRAADLALAAISGRTISLATGIVMHQNGIAADAAEDSLRKIASQTGTDLHRVAASVAHSGSLEATALPRNGVARSSSPRSAH